MPDKCRPIARDSNPRASRRNVGAILLPLGGELRASLILKLRRLRPSMPIPMGGTVIRIVSGMIF